MARMLEVTSMLLVFYIVTCFQMVVTQIWKFEYPLVVLIIYYSYCIFRNIRYYKSSSDPNSQFYQTLELQFDDLAQPIPLEIWSARRKRIIIRAITEDSFLIFSSFVLMIYASEIVKIPFYVIIIPLALAIWMKIFMQRWPKSPCESIVHLSYIFASISRVLILTFVLMQADEIIQWKWSEILWGYWVTFSFLIIITLFSVILFLNSVCTYFQDEVDYQAILGSFWCLYFMCGVSGWTFF